MKKLIIFDMDGVLIDSEQIYHQHHPVYFRENLGIHLTQAEIDGFTGVSSREIFSRYKERYPEHLPQAPEYYVEHEYDILVELFGRLEPFPVIAGVVELLDALQVHGFRLALSSSNQRRMVELCLDRSGLRPYFERVLSGEDVARAKPDPELFSRQAEAFGFSPEACLVIEDSTNGTKAAQAAGMDCVGFVNPNSGNQDLSRSAWLVREWTPETIADLLERTGVPFPSEAL